MHTGCMRPGLAGSSWLVCVWKAAAGGKGVRYRSKLDCAMWDLIEVDKVPSACSV
jgi:hypothetical protein